jgi:site-specific recombinase XerD
VTLIGTCRLLLSLILVVGLAACASPQSTLKADATQERLAEELIEAHRLALPYATSTAIKIVTSEQAYIAQLKRETGSDALQPFITVALGVFRDLWPTSLKVEAAKALAAELSREDLVTLLDPAAVEEVRGKPRQSLTQMRYSTDRLTKAMVALTVAEVSAVRRMAEIVGPQVKERIAANPAILKQRA